MPYTPTFSPATRLRLPPLSTAPAVSPFFRPLTCQRALERHRADRRLGEGVSDQPLLVSGHFLEIAEHPRAEWNDLWLLSEFVGLESVAALSALHPDHRALCDFPDLAVNCFAGAGRHWRSRMFSPA